MKEVTYEDWQKNPTPRMMWVWDNNINDKIKTKVVYIIKDGVHTFPVITVRDEHVCEIYKHCAEIEKQKQRRMTNKELSRWLREKPTREFKYDRQVCCQYRYYESESNEEVVPELVIRENDGEWREPLVELEG